NILANDHEAAFLDETYLITYVHKQISMWHGKEGFKSYQVRKGGFLRALRDSNLDMPGEYLVQGDYTMQSGFRAAETLLKLTNPPTALL
ncbi:LacI family transcriptional regulator, partial [Bacillus licheniformis]